MTSISERLRYANLAASELMATNCNIGETVTGGRVQLSEAGCIVSIQFGVREVEQQLEPDAVMKLAHDHCDRNGLCYVCAGTGLISIGAKRVDADPECGFCNATGSVQ